MASEPITLKGVILETREYKEKDRIVTILTGTHGILHFIAKGSSKPGSKNSAVSIPYMLCEFVLTQSHDFFYLKEVSIISSNSGIMNSLEAMAVAGHCANCFKLSTFQSDNSADAYELAVYSFYALSEMPQKHIYIYSAFNWKLLGLLGLAAPYASCNGCSQDIINLSCSHYYLSYNDNLCYCENCGTNYCGSRKTEFAFVDLSSVNLLDKILLSEYGKIFMINVNDIVVNEIRIFTTEYLRRQFEQDICDPVKKLERELWKK